MVWVIVPNPMGREKIGLRSDMLSPFRALAEGDSIPQAALRLPGAIGWPPSGGTS